MPYGLQHNGYGPGGINVTPPVIQGYGPNVTPPTHGIYSNYGLSTRLSPRKYTTNDQPFFDYEDYGKNAQSASGEGWEVVNEQAGWPEHKGGSLSKSHFQTITPKGGSGVAEIGFHDNLSSGQGYSAHQRRRMAMRQGAGANAYSGATKQIIKPPPTAFQSFMQNRNY